MCCPRRLHFTNILWLHSAEERRLRPQADSKTACSVCRVSLIKHKIHPISLLGRNENVGIHSHKKSHYRRNKAQELTRHNRSRKGYNLITWSPEGEGHLTLWWNAPHQSIIWYLLRCQWLRMPWTGFMVSVFVLSSHSPLWFSEHGPDPLFPAPESFLATYTAWSFCLGFCSYALKPDIGSFPLALVRFVILAI